MKYNLTLKLAFFIIFIFLTHQKTFSQCFEIESILVDACDNGTDEGFNEMVRFKVGSASLNTSNLSVNWPSNSWQNLIKNSTTATKVAALNAQITAAGGCGKLIEPTGGVLPANAKVILVTSYNLDTVLNTFGALSEDIYIIFQNNDDVTDGHFGNFGSSATRTLTMSFGSCKDTTTYNRSLLIDEDGNKAAGNGATVNFTPNGVATYVNDGCKAPVDVFSVDAGSTPVSACPSATIALSGTAQGQQSVVWSASSGSFSSANTLATNYTIDPSATGSITLTLKATNSCGVNITDTVLVNINTGTSPIINCGTTTGSSIQFSWVAVTGATAYSISYQIENGTPTSYVSIGNVLNYTVNGLASGTNVTITVLPIGGVGTCFVSSSKTCTTNGCVPPTLIITNPSAVCSPTTVDITLPSVTAGSTSLGTLSYWTNAAATIVLANPTAIAISGTYYIKSTSGTCSDIKPVVVTINTAPVLVITNPSAICSPTTIDITLASVTAGSTGSGTLSYWTNAAATTVLANPTAIAISGTYYIKSTSGTCSDIKPVVVTINTTPVLVITNPPAICSPATVDITLASVTAGSTGLGTLSYWTNVTATTVLANPTAIAISRTYYIKSTSGVCSDIKPVIVSISTDFDFEITGGCVNGSYVIESKPISNSFDSATAKYQWKNDLGNNIGDNEPTLNVSDLLASTSVIEQFPITYNLVVTKVGGCSKTKSFSVYGVFCAIPKGISPDGNSKNDEFDLTGLGVQELYIYNRYGTEVNHFKNYTNEWYGQTNKGDKLPDGTYYYSIHKADGTSATGWVYVIRKY